MKRYFFLLLVLVLPMSLLGQTFSGTFLTEFEDFTKKEKGTILWSVQGDLLAMETEMKQEDKTYQFRTVLNAINNTLSIETKTADGVFYHQFSSKDLQDDPDAKSVVLTPANERKPLHGVSCRKMIASATNHTSEIWVAENYDFRVSKFGELLKSPYGFPGLIEKSVKGFPMEITTRDNVGKIIFTMKVTEVKTGKVDKKQFEMQNPNK